MKEYTFHRRYDEPSTGNTTVSKVPYRADTVVVLLHDDHTFAGVSRCSWKDQFSRKVGHKIAQNRAYFAVMKSTQNSDRLRRMAKNNEVDIKPRDKDVLDLIMARRAAQRLFSVVEMGL